MHAYRELNANRIIVLEGVLEIDDGAFSEFRKATYIDIPRSIKTLDLSVFKTMKSLNTVFLQDGTTKLSNIDKLINKVSVNHDDIDYETTNSEVNDETDRVEDANKERLDLQEGKLLNRIYWLLLIRNEMWNILMSLFHFFFLC